MKNIVTNARLLQSWLTDSSFDSSLLQDEKKLRQLADHKTLQLFHQVAARVPAYKSFLKKHNITPLLIKTIADYKKLPTTTKENYIQEYSFQERTWDGTMKNMHMVSTSSGTTGKPHYWPRDLQNEIEGAYIHELLLRDIFEIKAKKTLFINGFALGNWIAGTFTSACITLVAWKGYPLTLMSPGYDADAIFEILENVANEYEQIIISGHIPFLKEVIELAVKKNINIANVKLLGTGQGITENWRSYLLNEMQAKNYNDTIINLYGSADAALMGFETPVSITLRQELSRNYLLNKRLFHSERLPSLYNYDPRFTYFEEIKKELTITKNLGCPLIRYNIHDEGGVLSYQEVSQFFSTGDLQINSPHEMSKYHFPFLYLFGRDKFMVKIYGANVYSEHVQFALNHEKLQKLLTGRYILEMDYSQDQNPIMICRIELNAEVKNTPDLANLIQDIFITEVKKVNSEYKDALGRMGDKIKPRIILHEHGHEKYFPKGVIKKTS